MNSNTLRALEFDRIVAAVADLAVTPTGRDELAELHPLTDPALVAARQRATTEGTRFLADRPGFPLRAPSDLDGIIDALAVEGRALEALRLVALADYLESIEHSRTAVRNATIMFPILRELVDRIASFKGEIADVRKKIDPSGEVADNASPALASIRERLRRQRAKLRTTLEAFLRGRETSKYLQEQVVTDRNGRYVLVVRSEHRSAIPGIVHGASASGASLFLEPLTTVDVNNDIVALEEAEAEEVRRILLALTDHFRERPDDLRRTIDVATELDVIQARARFSQKVDGVEPALSMDGTFELRNARHPLLIPGLGPRGSGSDDRGDRAPSPESRVPAAPVPNDILLIPPTQVMLITGPNTGGKTVALKTAGLLALMAQAGLHVPAEHGSRLPVFQSVFADIGDEQSIAASLSTFSAHISNVVSMDRNLELPALVLIDEVGAGTDPVEGGALGIALIDHFRNRGAHLVATTHYDALKSYASTTEGVTSAAFGFDPESFAPTYRLIYGSPGRSLAIEIAARLGMPRDVIAAARNNLTEEQKQLADHLARVDKDLRTLEQERRQLSQQRAAMAESERKLRGREESIREREDTFRRRLDTKLDDQLRDARRKIDEVIDDLKTRAPRLVNTGDLGAVRGGARAAVQDIVGRVGRAGQAAGGGEEHESTSPTTLPASPASPAPPDQLEPGVRVTIAGLGLEGTVIELRGKEAEIDVHGKRMRARVRDLRAIGGPAPPAKVNVNIDLQPREGSLSELNVIGQTVDDAITRLEKFLDESTVTDQHTIRIVHGHGTGQLRRAIAAFLKKHPLVAHYELAPQDQGGGGATIVELKD